MPQLIFILYLTLSLIPVNGLAIEPVARQDTAAIVPIVEAYLQSQTGKLPGQSKITVTPPDTRLDLPACPKPETFLPTGARLQGRVTVGVRCREPSRWTIYVQAQISVSTQYLVTAAPLAQGHVISENDLTVAAGELNAASAGLITDMAQAIGRTLAAPIAAGLPLRSNLFRKDWVVHQGQVVRFMTSGEGFRITVEAKALANASEGELVQVKTKYGRVLSGTARSGGIVEKALSR